MTKAIALPKGKHIEQKVLDELAASGVEITREHPLAIEATVKGLGDITRAIFCRSDQMIKVLMEGYDGVLGIIGKDMFLGSESYVVKQFGSFTSVARARGVFFTRADNDAKSLQDMLNSYGWQSDIASEYPNQTRRFLESRGHLQVCRPGQGQRKIHPCKGAETLVCATTKYLYGVALVETGTTLAVNSLQEIKGSEIFDSCAVLVGEETVDKKILYTTIKTLNGLTF